jgi:integrase
MFYITLDLRSYYVSTGGYGSGVTYVGYDIEDFLRGSGAGASTLNSYRRQLRQVEGWIGGTGLGDMTTRNVDFVKAKLHGLASGPQYALLLRMFYKRAAIAAGRAGDKKLQHRYEGIRDDFVLKQRMKRLSPNDILTPKEVEAMIQVCASARDKALIGCLWETGVRVHELLAVNLGDIREKASPENHGRTVYHVWFGKNKTPGEEHEGYVIEAAPLLRSWLNAHPDRRPDAPLFPGYTGNRMTTDDALYIVKHRAKQAGIEKRVYNHLFRHSRATFLLASGMSEARVKALLGWKAGSNMLARYSHLVSKDAYAGLLQVYGMQPETVEVERLSFEDEALKPVVPMVTGPSKQADAMDRIWEKAETDPKVRELVELGMKAFVEMAKNPAALKAFVAAMESKE